MIANAVLELRVDQVLAIEDGVDAEASFSKLSYHSS